MCMIRVKTGQLSMYTKEYSEKKPEREKLNIYSYHVSVFYDWVWYSTLKK